MRQYEIKPEQFFSSELNNIVRWRSENIGENSARKFSRSVIVDGRTDYINHGEW